VAVAFAQESIIVGDEGDNVLVGTPAGDSIYGRGGADILLGGPGEDELDGGSGADIISGGPDKDSVAYAGAPVTVILDGLPNDGAVGEGDNIGIDVEDVYGTESADTLIGSDRENTLDGLGGNDQITGGPGQDGLYGGDGDDTIRSRDGSADRVECGPGIDSAFIDARDSVAGDCETKGLLARTENFQLARPPRTARLTRLNLANISTGSRITIACISRCRPSTPRTKIVVRRRSVLASGAARRVNVRIRRSPLVAGATFEVGVKARGAEPRCRRFKLASQGGRILGLITPKTRCRSVARNG
jgi:Ca2+-binding RTX toxin-like protein